MEIEKAWKCCKSQLRLHYDNETSKDVIKAVLHGHCVKKQEPEKLTNRKVTQMLTDWTECKEDDFVEK